MLMKPKFKLLNHFGVCRDIFIAKTQVFFIGNFIFYLLGTHEENKHKPLAFSVRLKGIQLYSFRVQSLTYTPPKCMSLKKQIYFLDCLIRVLVNITCVQNAMRVTLS